MAGLNINMTEELRAFVDERIGAKGFSTPTEYVRQLIREDRERADEEKLEQLLLAGLDSGDAGELNDEAWGRIEKKARARIQAKLNKKSA